MERIEKMRGKEERKKGIKKKKRKECDSKVGRKRKK